MKIDRPDFNTNNIPQVRNSATQTIGYTKTGESTAVSTEQLESATASSQATSSSTKLSTDTVELSKDAQSINKMSDEERAELVKSLKADQENQMTRFMNMMTGIFQKQGITELTAGSDSFWQTIASGNFSVDAATKAEAQEAISEDGYWGVKQTSQRIFDFACALAGDDVDKMREMQDAVYKGYEQATAAWGSTLPTIAQDTLSAVESLFEDYYAAYAQ